MKFIIMLLVVLISLFSAESFAISEDSPSVISEMGTKEKVRSSLAASCPQSLFAKMQNDTKIMPFLDAQKLAENACTCALNSFFSDSVVKRIFNLPEPALKEKMNSPDFRAYFSGVFIASSFSCLGDAMNEQVKNANLKF